MTWQTEFKIKYNAQELRFIDWLLANGFEDTSWHNDACPSFERDNLRVWLDFPQDQSELGDWHGWTKYAAYFQHEYGFPNDDKPRLDTHSLAQLKGFIDNV